ncbi:hypothetical protein AC579_4662 [Pseudocercospora musae]|uniref:Uncharacterized protein n=1 Tax=Pseudocercospora musae TaxID=113226 RepID=A0A139IB63_9PEZI|nr:hypothetical protein AC579_4662 [Pseudocercospora musae]
MPPVGGAEERRGSGATANEGRADGGHIQYPSMYNTIRSDIIVGAHTRACQPQLRLEMFLVSIIIIIIAAVSG